MGGFFSLWWRRPPPQGSERRAPISELEEIIPNPEAHEKIALALEACPPGTAFRWDKFLKEVNREFMPTEEQPDPIRLRIEMDVLKALLRLNYLHKDAVNDDKFMTGIALQKQLLPV